MKDKKLKSKRFFKKEKHKEKQTRRFPSISRIIPAFDFALQRILSASLHTGKKILMPKMLFFSLASFILLAAIFVEGRDVYANMQRKQESDAKREKIAEQIVYWKNITKKYKGYRDGYFQLAVLSYQLGDKEQSSTYLKEAFVLDPNFEDGRKLERVLSSKVNY